MDQLANLMSYTVFHIGAYITLAAAVIAGGAIDLDHLSLRVSVVCMLVAGVCGGTIASKIPDYSDWKTFAADRIGPWGLKLARYPTWATIEHLAFWIGIIVPAMVYLIGGTEAFKAVQP
jgi:hypothetical protein